MTEILSKYKNIIMINDFDYTQGGASTVAIETANGLADRGFNVTFFSVVHSCNTTLNSKVNNVTLNGEEALKCNNKIKGARAGVKNVECGNVLDKLLENFSPVDTIAHIHGWTKACSSIIFDVLKRKNIKIVLTLHDYFAVCPNGAFLNYNTNRCCDFVPCSIDCLKCNCDSRNYIFKIYRFIREKQYYKDINLRELNCIFVSKLQMDLISKYKKIGDNSEIICSPIEELDSVYQPVNRYDYVYIGRDSREKGIDLFIKLSEQMPDKRFLIVGDYSGNMRKNLSSTGWVSEMEVEHFLKDSKCLVVPSLLPEPFGLVVVKAVAFGVRCLVSDNIGAVGYIRNNTGLTFKQGDFDDLLNKAKEIEKLQKLERKDVLVSRQKYVDNIVSFYSKLS